MIGPPQRTLHRIARLCCTDDADRDIHSRAPVAIKEAHLRHVKSYPAKLFLMLTQAQTQCSNFKV
eukprot:5142161-Amphidinium_carterae.1